jgi:hypothetical protein
MASHNIILLNMHDEGYVDELNMSLPFDSRKNACQEQQRMMILLRSYGRRVRLWLVSNEKKIPFMGRWPISSAISLQF